MGKKYALYTLQLSEKGEKQLFIDLSWAESFWNKIKQNQKSARKVANSRVSFFTKKTASNLHRQTDTKKHDQSRKLAEKHTQCCFKD